MTLAALLARRDRWRFLTPEVECLAPGLVAALAAAAGRRADAQAEERELDRLAARGREREWFAHLRRLRELAEAAERGGGPPELVHRLALVLRDQYELAPSVHELSAADEQELRRLERLVAATAPAQPGLQPAGAAG